MSSPTEFKKRRGRPPSKTPSPPLEKKGVGDAPNDSNNRLEFVFNDPMVFKSLFTYFKNIKTRYIHLRCSRTALTFFARDHSKTSRIIATVAGEHVNWHYCDGEFWLGINRDQVEKIFASIDKTFFKITIIQTQDDHNSLTIIFKDADIDKECNYKINLAGHIEDNDLYEAENTITPTGLLTHYPIEFTLTAKQFKKTVNDASNYSESITFEKLGEEPLQLTYVKSNIMYNEVYRSSSNIRLRSDVAQNMIFRCVINISNIKSLASSMVTDDIRILCKEEGDILFRSAIDERALVVNTLTKIV